MRLNKQRNVGLVLNLLTLLMLGGNGWLYGMPKAWAQGDVSPSGEIVDAAMEPQATLDKAVARELLAQIQVAANGLQDPGNKNLALSAIALTYGELYDDTTVGDLLTQLLTSSNDNPDIQASNLYNVLNVISTLSDEAVIDDVLSELLTTTQSLPKDQDKVVLLAQITEIVSRLSAQTAVHNFLRPAIAFGQSTDASLGKARLFDQGATFYISVSDEAAAIDLPGRY